MIGRCPNGRLIASLLGRETIAIILANALEVRRIRHFKIGETCGLKPRYFG